MAPPYVWDTSALLNWDDWYPGDLMPQMWTLLDDHVSSANLVVPFAVVEELGTTTDFLAKWLKSLPKALTWQPSTEDPKLVGRLQRDFPAMAPKPNRPGVADAYVVAAAASLRGTVVSDERSRSTDLGPGPPYSKNKRMDAACAALGVEFSSSRNFMRLCLDNR